MLLSTGRASTTTSRARRGASAKPRFVALTSASVRSSSREAARFRPATARDAIHRRASRGRRARRACLLGTSPGHASPSARASANNTGRVASETTVPRRARHAAGVHDERFRRQQRFDLLEQQEPLLATRNQARRGRVQDEAMRFRPPPSARECRLARGALRPGRARRAPPSSAGAASRSPRPPARGRPATRAARGAGRARRAHARPRRGARSAAGAGPRDSAHARRSRGRRALRASPAPRRAPSRASPGRARRARSRPRRRRTARGPRPLSDRRRAPRFAAERLRPNEIAELRHRDAAQRERRRVVAQATRFNAPSGSPAASARAAAVISESIGIPPHLSLPPFDARS
jgi:hypothetical protein